MAIKKFKLAGVVGGMGPLATIDFLNKVIVQTRAKKDQQHIPMLVYTNPQIPDRTKAILKGGKSPRDDLIRAVKLLKKSGADFIVIPCVSAHFWLADIRKNVRIPILSIIDVVLKKIKNEYPKLKRFGIMGTDGVIKSGLFQKALSMENLICLVPEKKEQERYVMKGIYAIKKGAEPKNVKPLFLHALSHLIKMGAQAIILGCTEIPLSLTPNDTDIPLIDVNKELARETVKFASIPH